ncbi:MAG: hypothetical protein AAGI14_11345 [Pseudomonadota bacterium]
MIRFASILAASAAFGLAAQAGEAVTFETVDADGSGLITESEFVGWKTSGDSETSSAEAIIKFLSIDTDGSGGITPEEFDAAMATSSDMLEEALSETDGLSDS